MVPGPLFIDAHTHLHSVYALEDFFAGAAHNVTIAAKRAGTPSHSPVGVLLFAEGSNEGAFSRLSAAGETDASGWSVHATREAESLLVRKRGTLRLVAIAGRQIVTAEGVEVLALLTPQSFPDGLPLSRTITDVQRSGAIPVLPWGFGKWTMRRGALVADVLESGERGVFLGDNSGRLGMAATPSLFAVARNRRVPILPGSDPLPFRNQQTRAGSFGFIADVTLDEERPAEGLRAWLRKLETQPATFGRLETLGAFVANQLRMQWRKRIARPG
jgi:hypothetical protein